jgi:hypothetical protein
MYFLFRSWLSTARIRDRKLGGHAKYDWLRANEKAQVETGLFWWLGALPNYTAKYLIL